MRQGDGVAGIGEGAEHLGVGEDLPGVRAGEPEQLTQQGRLLDPVEKQDVT